MKPVFEEANVPVQPIPFSKFETMFLSVAIVKFNNDKNNVIKKV